MRTHIKLGSLSLIALVVACGSATPDAENAGAPGDVPVAQEGATNGSDGDEAGKINALVAAAGHLSTDKKADAAPVALTQPKTLQVPGEGGTTYQCKYTDYSLTKVPEKFVALNPNADVLWPGSLVQGKSMAGGILDPVPVKRAPGTITLTLASGGGGPFFKKMDEPSLSAATQAQNEILASYTGKTPAKFSYSFQSIYSSEQLAVAVDANVEGTNWSAAAALSVDKKDEKSRFLIQFSQEYFTMAFDAPQGAAGVFAKGVTAEDLAPYAAAGTPPVYVSGVTYGRIFYILFESKASSLDLEAAVKGSYSGPSVSASGSASASWKQVINESTVKAYGLGGNAELAINAVTGTDQFEKIRTFLVSGANFDKDNPGVPISYTIRHLTDASQVKLALTTEYTAKDCVPQKTGCDGVLGSGKVADKCGVCGGDGTTCDSCAASTLQARVSNGAYVNFNVGAANHGHEAVFPDGSYYKYTNAYCHRIFWGNVRIACHDGAWSFSGGQSIRGDIQCNSDSNASWAQDPDSISTGWQP
jgi:thiol-activated cytolysin